MMQWARSISAVFVGVAAILGSTSCTVAPDQSRACDRGIGVVWSSQYDPTTIIEFWDQSGKRGTARAGVQGAIPIAANVLGPRAFASNGDVSNDRASMTLVDRERCSSAVHPLEGGGVLAAASSVEGLAVVYNGSRTGVDVYGREGNLLGSHDMSPMGPSTVIGSARGVVTVGTEFHEGKSPSEGPIRLLALSADSRSVSHDVNLTAAMDLPPVLASVHEMALLDDHVFLALTYFDNPSLAPPLFQHRKALTVVSLATGVVSEIPLEQDMPYQVLEHKGLIYVAHTFLNPGVRPFSEYRWVSRVNPATKQVDTFDVGPNLSAIAFDRDDLYVLHYDGVGPATLDVRNPQTMEILKTHDLPKPKGKHYYISGIGLGNPPT